ncbi:hypothetical protein [Nannocystis sp.]|uniref:hypothetical protein n=1 Tax=Nannocystis sp. TaxID=1962667 RepID=UPI0025FB4C4E|nr:hypothetical protein [Nannocystis sp.]MBK7829357.1 hypothetical protein [Nannocystis sp.]
MVSAAGLAAFGSMASKADAHDANAATPAPPDPAAKHVPAVAAKPAPETSPPPWMPLTQQEQPARWGMGQAQGDRAAWTRRGGPDPRRH